MNTSSLKLKIIFFGLLLIGLFAVTNQTKASTVAITPYNVAPAGSIVLGSVTWEYSPILGWYELPTDGMDVGKD